MHAYKQLFIFMQRTWTCMHVDPCFLELMYKTGTLTTLISEINVFFFTFKKFFWDIFYRSSNAYVLVSRWNDTVVKVI